MSFIVNQQQQQRMMSQERSNARLAFVATLLMAATTLHGCGKAPDCPSDGVPIDNGKIVFDCDKSDPPQCALKDCVCDTGYGIGDRPEDANKQMKFKINLADHCVFEITESAKYCHKCDEGGVKCGDGLSKSGRNATVVTAWGQSVPGTGLLENQAVHTAKQHTGSGANVALGSLISGSVLSSFRMHGDKEMSSPADVVAQKGNLRNHDSAQHSSPSLAKGRIGKAKPKSSFKVPSGGVSDA